MKLWFYAFVMVSLKTNNLKQKAKPTVFIGLSGGVDSAVSAAILQEKGYSVTGVFIKVWTPDFLPCTWREDRRDAMRVCAHLGIPFITLDLEKEYKNGVVDYMIAEYRNGRTPNPDVMCNKEVKFGAFYDFAIKNGADFVATGHYSQILKDKNKEFVLKEGKDEKKDQSYFVWNITKQQLPYILFPIGGVNKVDVRKLAKKFKLPNFEKKDSQGLCFLGKVDMKDFLKHFIKEKKGHVLDVSGKKIGTHDGVMFLTVGQRHGFSITNKKNYSKPLFVIKKDIKKNTVTVSDITLNDSEKLGIKSCKLIKTNWHKLPAPNKTYKIRFRYHQKPLEGFIVKDKKGWGIELKETFLGISKGQSAVIYDDEELVGGGIIS